MKFFLVLLLLLPCALGLVSRRAENPTGLRKEYTAIPAHDNPRRVAYSKEFYARLHRYLEETNADWVSEPTAEHVNPRTISAHHFTFTLATSFPSEALNCFLIAGQLLSIHLDLSTEVYVEASWSPAGSVNNLGSAGSTYLWSSGGVWRVDSLHNEIIEMGQASPDPDIVANFNSIFPAWSFATDGSTGAGEYDLVTVIMHELCHGLGFSGLDFNSTGAGNIICHYNPSTGQCYGTLPSAFEQYLRTSPGGVSISSYFTSGSQATYENIYTSGTGLNFSYTACGKAGPNGRIYTPDPYESGSTGSHFDESLYATGTPASLMTPTLAGGEVLHHPGGHVLDTFECMGYTLVDCNVYTTNTTCLNNFCSWCEADTICGQPEASDRPGYNSNCNGTWENAFAPTSDPDSASALFKWLDLF
jgi:hypothetical protein